MRQIAVLSVALIVSLVASYFTWTDDGEEPTDEVVAVYHATEADLQKLVWKGEDLEVTMERRKDDRGEYLWVESTETKHTKKHEPPKEGEDPDEHPEDHPGDPAETPATPEAPAPAEPEPEPTVVLSKFVANAQADETWKAFAPLNALRELDVAGADPAVLGLTDSKTTLEVVRGSGPLKLAIGGETYGNKDRYVGLDNKVYLVDDGTLRPIQFASSRLMERSLFPYEESAIERVTVELPGKQLAYVQQNKDDRAKAFWAKAETPDKTDDVGGTWLGKVFKLKLKDYVDASTVTGTLEPVLTYTVSGKDGDWRIELLKVTTGETTQWYAKSPYNRSLVTLTESLARNVIDDLDSLQ